MKIYENPASIKVATIGYGGYFNMGEKHMTQMRQAGMTPVAVCELDAERLDLARIEQPDCQRYSDLSTMLRESKPDLVSVITPTSTHAPLALQCLQAGANVVCEKPFALTTDECDALIAESQKQDRIVTAYHNRHWDGIAVRAQEVVRSGVIGELTRIEAMTGGYRHPRQGWRGSMKLSGGILYDWGVHFLEYVFQAVDSDIMEVSGFSHSGFWKDINPYGEDSSNDSGAAIVRFRNGAYLHLHLSDIETNKSPFTLTFCGTKGTYACGLGAAGWELRLGNVDGEPTIEKGENPPDDWPRFYQNIADALSGKEALIITPEWARRPIHVLDLATRSAAEGRALMATYH